MKVLPLLILVVLFGISGCSPDSKGVIHYETNGVISIFDLNSDSLIARVEGVGYIELPSEEISCVMLKVNDLSYMTILRPGSEKKVTLFENSIKTNSPEDSVLNYLFRSTNTFIGQNSALIFGQTEPELIKELFEGFKNERNELLERSDLSTEVTNYLKYQNQARIYSFLFFVGRNQLNLPSNHSFYDFTDSIDSESTFAFSFPQNLLYAYENKYLKENDSISSVSSFISFIENQTSLTKLGQYLKIIYLKELIESPSYWEKHQPFFNSEVLKEVLANETLNPYLATISTTSQKYIELGSGKAPNFIAETLDNTQVDLKNYSGKFVFMDVWASWCGPCLKQRPEVLKMAEYFEGKNIVFLTVSIEKTKEEWNNFLQSGKIEMHENDLWVNKELTPSFERDYAIHFLPKYILIDEEGRIVDASLDQPSVKIRDFIEEKLSAIPSKIDS